MCDDIHSQILISELRNLPRKRSFYKITSLFTGPTLKQHSMFKKKTKKKKFHTITNGPSVVVAVLGLTFKAGY